MSLSLTPDLVAQAERMVATGRYADVEQVVHEALALMARLEKQQPADARGPDDLAEFPL